MQSAAQRDATRNGAGGSGQGERSQPFRADLVHWKWQANYWRSQHARAKERIAAWQAKWKATQQELADALRRAYAMALASKLRTSETALLGFGTLDSPASESSNRHHLISNVTY